ncbi:MAG: tRNA (guanosine(37)-N1)-methyltransferase TrmD [Dehalococcoidia bacterium]|nr:tRNA (guanosine(37)-N1)-methyltransferase TrmD [Dehalococcoidia bacterium]
MRVDILTLFPDMFTGVLSEGRIHRAIESGALTVAVHNIRDWATDRHRVVDDYPYGGGAGMVLKPEPLFAAIEAVRDPAGHVILLTPQGMPLSQPLADELAQQAHLVLVCGHYEGVDERVREHAVDQELSIGDYVLSGGELPAMVALDTVTRLIPGVLGSAESLREESFRAGVLEYPHYTRPAEFRGWHVPDVLLSGHHAAIAAWRREQALSRTRARRPDLIGLPSESASPTDDDQSST